jgi:Domain of unknown function (DUF4382)
MNKIFFLTATVFILIFTACKKDTSEETYVSADLQIRLTDAPAVYDSVLIDIVGVEVHSDRTNGWINLAVPFPGQYNLLQYANGLDTLIATANLPTGKVSQIRLILGTNNSVTKNGVTYPLTIPSGSQSGLKLQIHKEIIGGITNVILLDFDAGRSIVEQGNGVFHLKPVIRANAIGIDGSIAGSISPVVPAIAYAFLGTDTFTSPVNSNGNFLIGSVPAGTYTVCVVPDTIYPVTCISNVVVNINEQVNAGVITL